VEGDPAAAPGDHELLTIDEGRVGESVVLTVSGEVDVSTGPRLRAALSEALDGPGTSPVVVDLSAVTFLGSTGVAVLVDADWQAKQQKRPLRVVVDRDRAAVIHPLQATGTDRILAVHDDVGGALQDPPV
jgi:anti-sigma B factor antagonist